MDEQQKPFDTVSIVILTMLAIFNDALEIAFDLLAMTVVGLPGEAIMKPFDLLFDGTVTAWFFFKVGFGWPTIIQFIADIIEMFGIPSRTVSVLAGIWIANHPKSKIAQAAKMAATAEGGGAAVGKAAEGAEIGVAAERTEAAAEGAASGKTPTGGSAGEAEEAPAGKPSGEPEKSAREKEIKDELTPSAEKNPLDVEARNLNEGPTVQDIRPFNNAPPADADDDDEDEIAA